MTDEAAGQPEEPPAPASAAEDVTGLAEELERAARRLREDELEPDDAAALVDELADQAGRLAAALEREARAVPAAEPPGQETLL